MTPNTLRMQNHQFKGTGGVSQGNRSQGFVPAFRDSRSDTVYLSRFADGRIAPIHMLDGLPSKLVIRKTSSGKVIEVSDSVISGFIRNDRFYTRTQVAEAINSRNLL